MKTETQEWIRTRRRVLQAVGGLSMAAFAGCSASSEPSTDTPSPVSLGGGKQCDACGMVIERHAGPNAMAFYRENSPDGHENPARFDSVSEMVAYDAQRRQTGWERVVAYVTDYSSVEYTITTEEGTKRLSSHVEPASFVKAEKASYVVGSAVKGAMGSDFIPFANSGDAKSFSREHGGDVVAFADLPTSPRKE